MLFGPRAPRTHQPRRASAASSFPLASSLVLVTGFSSCTVAARAAGTCYRYSGTINGPSQGSAFDVNTTDECEAVCAAQQPGCYAFTFSPYSNDAVLLLPLLSMQWVDTCTLIYPDSNIGNGHNLPGTPVPDVATPADCCVICGQNTACESWTWACGDGTKPCPTGTTSAPW
jgi:hypothetical protein